MQAQVLLYTLAAMDEAEANLEAVDEAAVLLEDTDMDVDVEGDTGPMHQNAPIAAWITTPPKNAERHRNRPATPLEPVKSVIIVAKMDTLVRIAQSRPEQRKPEKGKSKKRKHKDRRTTAMHMPPWQESQMISPMTLNSSRPMTWRKGKGSHNKQNYLRTMPTMRTPPYAHHHMHPPHEQR